MPGHGIKSIDPGRKVAVLDDDTELPFDLFLGVPKHRAPDVVIESGMAENGYIPVESRTLATRYPDVYALGDCATVGVPKAGIFAERAASAVARALIAKLRSEGQPEGYDGLGSCYIEFGQGASPASTSTSSPVPSRPARTRRRLRSWPRRKRSSARAARPAGSAGSRDGRAGVVRARRRLPLRR